MNSVSRTNTRGIAVLLASCCVLASVAHAAEPVVLTNGVAVTGISGSAGSEKFYMIEVPAGQDELEIATSGGTGDVDLYVRRGSLPTTTSYDYRPYTVGNNETVTLENPTAGTWYVMLRGYNSYSGVTLLASYSAATTITPLKNGVPVTNISGDANAELYFSIDVPAGQTKLEITMSGGTGDADLYVKKGAMPTTTSYDYRPFLLGNDETVTVNNPEAVTWYVMIRGYSTFSGTTLVAGYGGLGTLLKDGVPVTDISGAEGSETLYRIEVPAGQTTLEIAISGGTGDADLYVKYGAAPTTTVYDFRPFQAGNNETVTINNPTAGTWYIMVRGYSNYSGLTLKATYGSVYTLQDNVPVTNLAGALGSEKFFKIDVPAGQDSLLIIMSGGTGDADMYIKRGSKPTTSDYDYRPAQTAGNTESISFGSGGGSDLTGSWYILIKAKKEYEGVTLKADYSMSANVVLLMNGVPVTGISGSAGTERHFLIKVPSDVQKLEIVMSGGTGDADLYVRRGAQPTTSQYDYRPFLSGNNESVTINNPVADDWYIMIRGYQAFSGVKLVATYTGPTPPPEEVVTLQNGVPVTGISGAAGSEKFYKITVPAGQAKLEIVMSGGTGDADLYVRKGSKPTTSEWDYRPFLIGNNESVTINNPAAATYYIMLRGYIAYSGVRLVASYGGGTPPPEEVTTLQNGVAVTGLSGAAGSEKFFKIDVPAAQDVLKIEMSGGTGDADMYVKKGSKPTVTSWDYRPYLIGNNESVEVTNPAAATWYIMLRGYQAYTGVSLKATYSAVPKGNNFTADPNAVAAWRFEPSKLTVDSVGSHTLTNQGVVAETTDVKEGSSSANLEFDEGDYMWISDASLSPKFPLSGEGAPRTITVAFWVKLESLPPADNTYDAFSKWNSTKGERTFATMVDPAGHVGFLIGISSEAVYEDKWTPEAIAPGVWYHIVTAFSNADKSYRINIWNGETGMLVADRTGKTKNNATVSDAHVFIGTRADLPANHSFDGLLDEMVVFNDLLTDAEIAKIREGTFGKP